MFAATKISNLSIFCVDSFFEREALMCLAFFIFHMWCCIALSHFSYFTCDVALHCPIFHLSFLLHTVAIVLSWQFVPEQWDMALCIILFSLVAAMWYHNTLFCCPVFASVFQSWGITILNCGRGTILSSSLVVILFSVDNNNWTCGRKFCGTISHLSVLLGTIPINNFVNHPFLCAGHIHALCHDIIFLCIHFQNGRISSCIVPLNLCISWRLMVSVLFGFTWMLHMHICFTVSETAKRWRKHIICTYC